MAVASQIVARITADLSNFKQGMAEARDDTEKTSGFLKGAFQDAIGVMGGILAAAGIQFSLSTIVGGLKDIISTGWDFDSSMQMLQARLTAITGSSGAAQGIIDWAKQFGQTVPDTTEHLDEAIVTLQGLGLNAEAIMPSLANIAAVMGVDLPTAAQAFSDAYQGRFEMLQMTMHVSKDQLVAYGLDLSNIQGTLGTALENFQKAKFPDGLKDSMTTFQGQMSNITDKFQAFTGMLMKPIFDLVQQGMKAFGDWMDAHKQQITDVATAIGQGVAGALQWVGQMAQQVAGFLSQIPFGEIAKNIGGLFSSFSGAGKGMDFSGIISQLQNLGNVIITQVLPIGLQLGDWFKKTMVPAIQEFMPHLQSFATFIVNDVVPAMIKIETYGMQVGAVIAKTLLPIFETIEPIIVKVAGFLLDMGQKALAFLIPQVESAFKAVSQFATEISTRLAPFINQMVGFIQLAATVIENVWGFLWPWVSGILQTAWDIIKGIVQTLWDTITGIFKIGADILSGNWGQLWTDVKGLFDNIHKDLMNIAQSLWDDLKHLWDVGTGYIHDVWSTVWNGLAGIASSAWDGVKGVIRNGINGAIDLINDMIRLIDKVPGVPHINEIGHVSFAFGGQMPYSGVARVGDAGGPEYAFFPQGTQVVSASDAKRYMQQGAAGGGGGMHIHVHGVVDAQMIGSVVEWELKKVMLQHGF